MSEHDWTGWPEDEGPDFAEADTADLGDGGYGETGFGGEPGFGDAGFDADRLDIDGFDEPGAGGEAGEPAQQPLGYGDAFAEEPFGAEPDTGPAEPHAGLGPDAGPGAEAGPEAGTGSEEVGFGPAEDAPFGADPDVDATSDDQGWESLPFPEPLDLGGAPEPVDGFPWTDAAVLGDGAAPLPDPAAEPTGTPEPRDLFAYAGEDAPAGGAGWSVLAASPDPATSSLARWWAPHPG